MRTFALAVAVFAVSFALTATAFVQTAQTKPNQPTTKQTANNKQQVRCPVSGKVLTDLKKAPRLTYQGKTYYFCCNNCRAKFQKEPQKYIKAAANTNANKPATKTDTKSGCCDSDCTSSKEGKQESSCCTGKQPAQTAAAPSDKLICPVSGEELKPETAVRLVYNGKVYYVGCESCKATFLKDPATYAKKAEQLSKLQGKPESEETAAASEKLICPVSEEAIEIASAVRFTYNGKVYYTCCNSCKRKFLSDPETYAAKAERLSKLQGKPETEAKN